ncbi:hypothetical protein GCM10023205_46560 [Yinghuangia aomiensis]|uniref:Uncharacterized protein n=1 Tax=Yinghuangia aomiensis TaxID=676205 RepID=A0ABP9HMT3_9ACTN
MDVADLCRQVDGRLPLLAGHLRAGIPDRLPLRGGDVVGEEAGGSAQQCECVIHAGIVARSGTCRRRPAVQRPPRIF